MNTDALVNINGGRVPTLELFLILTIISLLPSILVMMTSFTRIVIILSFTRNALGIQQTPPNMVLVGIALFLTLFIMDPVIKDVNTNAYQPYIKEEISQGEALNRAQAPMKKFMLKQTEKTTLNLFVDLSNTDMPEKILCAPVSTAAPVLSTGRMAQMDDTAKATAMGTPAKSITTKSTKIISPQTTAIFILPHPPFC